MKKIIVFKMLFVCMFCSFASTLFCQDNNTYSANQLIIVIETEPPGPNEITGMAAFTTLGGSIVDIAGDNTTVDPTFPAYLVEFELPNTTLNFYSIEDVRAFYACGQGVLPSGVIVKVRKTNFNYTMHLPSAPTIPSQGAYDLYNYAPYMNCSEPYRGFPGAAGCGQLKIGVIDSGHQPGTPFDHIVSIEEGINYVDNDYPPITGDDHGTMVSSIIAGETVDHHTNLTIVPIQVLGTEGDGTLWDFYQGLNYSIENTDISVVCLDAVLDAQDICIPVFETLLKKALLEDNLIIGAAGNRALDVDPNTEYYSIPASGESPTMIIVGGSSCFMDVAGFSNFGESNVDLFAPSEFISVYPSGMASGTSFAAPQIASIAATRAIIKNEVNAKNLRTFVLGNIVDRGWGQFSVTGGTFNYFADFGFCGGADLREDETTETIESETSFGLKAYFSNTELVATVNAPVDSKAQLIVQHLSGMTIAQQAINLSVGENKLDLNQMNVASMPIGVYFVTVQTATGEQLVEKCIKLRN